MCPGSTRRPRSVQEQALSGIAFENARVSDEATIGHPGKGLVEVLKTLQITRTAIGALSLGTMDAVLRIGLQYSRERYLYGASIFELPIIRQHLVNAYLDALVAEYTTIPVARSLTVCPGRLSLWSSVVKYLVPVLGEEVIGSIQRVLAARSYLCEGFASGIFQKLQRDHAIASVFEGTTHVNLYNIAAQLPSVSELGDFDGEISSDVLHQLFDLSTDPPTWSPSGQDLQLTNEGCDEITSSWHGAVHRVRRLPVFREDPERSADIGVVTDQLSSYRSAFYRGVGSLDPGAVESFRAAERHCLLHAATSCVNVWAHSSRLWTEESADLLILCLQRIVQRLGFETRPKERYLKSLESFMERTRLHSGCCALDHLERVR